MQVFVDPSRPFDAMLKELLTLPCGRIIQRCGILQSADLPQFAVDGLKQLGKEPGLLPKALFMGIPSETDVRAALECIYAAENEHLPVVSCGRTSPDPRRFYINNQGNFLACAQKTSLYKTGEPRLCFDTLMSL